MNTKSLNAIVLSGGTSSRFGSDKASAKINGQTLLELLITNLLAEGIEEIVVVGPKVVLNLGKTLEVAAKITFVREAPEFGGPVAAIAAAISEIQSEQVAIFATDMPFAPKFLPALKARLDAELESKLESKLDSKLGSKLAGDAALIVDSQGFAQPLAALYQSAPLKEALSELAKINGVSGQSMKRLIIDLKQVLVPLHETQLNPDYLLDIDTPQALELAIDLQSRLV